MATKVKPFGLVCVFFVVSLFFFPPRVLFDLPLKDFTACVVANSVDQMDSN